MADRIDGPVLVLGGRSEIGVEVARRLAPGRVVVLAARRSGELAALAGGHFMAGAWAMVVLYDYARGHDFRPEGLELQKPMFVLFDELLIERFEQRLANPAAKLDFRRYSKALNPKLTRYNFHMEHLLR